MKKRRNITHQLSVIWPSTHDFSTCEKKRNVLKTNLIMRHFAHIFVLSAAFAMSACNLTQRGDLNPPQQRAAKANAIENSASSSLSGGGNNGVSWRGTKSFAYVLSPENQCGLDAPTQDAKAWEVDSGTSGGNAGPLPWEVNSGVGAGRITIIGVDDTFSANKYGQVLNNGSNLINNGQQVVGNAGQTLGNLNFSADSKVSSNIAVNPFKVWVTQEKGLYGIPMDRNSGTLDFSYVGREIRLGQATNLIATNILHVTPSAGPEERREYVFASLTGTSQIQYVINSEVADTGKPLRPIRNSVSFSHDLPGSYITSLTAYGDLLAVGFRQGDGVGARGKTALCKIRTLTNEIAEPAMESLISGNSYNAHGCWLRNQVGQEQASVDNWFGSNVGWLSVLPNIGVEIMPDVPALAEAEADLQSIYEASVLDNARGIQHVTLQSEKRNAVNMNDESWHFKKVAGGQDRTIIALQNNGQITAYSLDNIIATGSGHKEGTYDVGPNQGQGGSAFVSDMAMAPGILQKDGTYERNGTFMVVTQSHRNSVRVLPITYGLPSSPTQETEVVTRCKSHKLAIRPLIKSDFRD